MSAPIRATDPAPDLSTVHAFLPATPLDTPEGAIPARRLAAGLRLRGRTGWLDLLDVAVVRPSPAACVARPALRSFVLDPRSLAPNLPAAHVRVAAGTPFLVDLGGGEVVAARGLDLAEKGVGRLGPAGRPAPLRRLRLSRADAVLAAGLWVIAGAGGDVPLLSGAALDRLDGDDLRRGLRRANAASVLRGLCGTGTSVAA